MILKIDIGRSDITKYVYISLSSSISIYFKTSIHIFTKTTIICIFGVENQM